MNIKITLCFIALAVVLLAVPARSNNIEFEFFGGLSIPNDEVSKFFNADTISARIDSLEGIGNFITNTATTMGYHLGIKARFELNKRFLMNIGIAYHRFNSGKYEIIVRDTVKSTKMDTAAVRSTPSMIPIFAGINAYIVRSNFISFYGVADLSYNMMNTSVDITDWGSIKSLGGIDDDETASRLGAGLGAGLDIDVKLLTVNLEFKYNWMNIIGKSAGESSRNYAGISLGVIL